MSGGRRDDGKREKEEIRIQKEKNEILQLSQQTNQ
jgi:hypothetical protein